MLVNCHILLELTLTEKPTLEAGLLPLHLIPQHFCLKVLLNALFLECAVPSNSVRREIKQKNSHD